MQTSPALIADATAFGSAEAPWNDLSDDDVRALAALVASPLLIAEQAAPIAMLGDVWRLDTLEARRPWLVELDRAPQRLHEHLSASNARQLGRYAEALWRFWLSRLPGARLHAAGLPVKDASAVRGEFDFIVSLPGLVEVQHLEMSYKFYLYCPPGDDFSRLFGPNTADRLDRKWRHMLEVQLPLSQTALGRAALPAHVGSVEPRACLQGWLFYPLATRSAAPIRGVSPAHWRGWWCRSDDWHRSDAPWSALAGAWTVLPRKSWIAPAAVADPAAVASADACRSRIETHFATSSQAQLVAGLSRAADGVWRETVRIFVVSPRWPQAAAAS